MRVLVVGGTGFVGGAISRALRDRGHEVCAYHRGVHAAPAGVKEICSPDAAIPVLRFPEELAFDAVVHGVAVGMADAAALVAAFSGARLVAISSGDVYQVYGALIGREPAPPAAGGPLREDAPLRKVEYPYGRGPMDSPWGPLRDYEKLHVEAAVLAAGGAILRLGKVYGAGDDVVAPLLGALRASAPVRIARPAWRWTHAFVEDVGLAAALAVESGRAAGRIYNVGESATPTQWERFELLARAARLPARGERGAAEDLPDLVLDSSRIVADLGFSETPRCEAFERIVESESRAAGP